MSTVRTAIVSLFVASILTGCGREDGIGTVQPPPPAQPTGTDERGNPPDWGNCFQGWRGIYSNLSIDHVHVTPRPADKPAPTDPAQLDWWDNPSFELFDPTLDHGLNWWPIDEGFEGDPAYFAVYWQAWIRAWSNTDVQLSLGAADDAWVLVDGSPIAEQSGIHDFARETYTVSLSAGQYPIEVFFAHRASQTSGFSFRVISGDVSICYPDFEDDSNGEE